MAHAAQTAYSGLSIAGYISQAIANFRENLATRKLYLDTINELQSLDDRDLADIGISRGQIEDIARAHAYGA
ncbi:DUF1127 domain-containing protein [Actibacterium pelagium]|uniref:YjiS-like domain-containing protein n=1 Tax=Actibacterium pelagium TaxID=2029103 RepID=A0A917A9C0_9RHOB|nr:DUF1127 domain-containing protein [Actibacterium pelagium]GGE36502.1 hypothetical protein GCM10011517_00310 [Actibacterium pelagium]